MVRLLGDLACGPETGFGDRWARCAFRGITLPRSRLLARFVESLFRGLTSGLPVIQPDPSSRLVAEKSDKNNDRNRYAQKQKQN
jgi:hypothetical protein